MRKRKLFLRWSLMVSVFLVGSAIAYFLGWFRMAWNFDVTKISFIIMALFLLATAYIGQLTWRAGEITERRRLAKTADLSREIREIELLSETGWIVHDYCEKLGLLGTLVGLVMVLVNFAGFQQGNMESASKLMGMMAVGLGTAYITTIVGLVCSLLLSLQLKHLERALERLKS